VLAKGTRLVSDVQIGGGTAESGQELTSRSPPQSSAERTNPILTKRTAAAESDPFSDSGLNMKTSWRWLRIVLSVLSLQAAASAGATTSSDLLSAAQADDRAGVARALAAGAPIDTRDVDGWSALMFAAAAGNVELVRTLLRAKADPNQRTKDGQTPLFAAVFAGKVEAVRALLQAGARPDMALPNGKTALTLAKERNRPDLVQLLQTPGGSGTGVKAQLAAASGSAAPSSTATAVAAPSASAAAVAPAATGVPDDVIRAFLEEVAKLEAQQSSVAAARAKLDAREQQALDERQQVAAAAQQRYETCLARVKTCESDCEKRSIAGVLGAVRPGTGRGSINVDSQAMLSASQDGDTCRLNCAQSAACEMLKP
jgi:hypothetical protein